MVRQVQGEGALARAIRPGDGDGTRSRIGQRGLDAREGGERGRGGNVAVYTSAVANVPLQTDRAQEATAEREQVAERGGSGGRGRRRDSRHVSHYCGSTGSE